MEKRNGSFRNLVWPWAVLLFLLAPGMAQGQNSSDLLRKLDLLNAYPDQIVVNGKIATIDAALRQVQAMAIKKGRIVALGTNDEIRFLAGPKTEVLDLKGRWVLPGLIDAHSHPHMFAVEHRLGAEGDITSKKYNDPQLKIVYAKGKDGTELLRSLERVVRQRAQEMGPGKWIWVTLYGGNDLNDSRDIGFPLLRPGGTITTQYLDTLAPNNPLIVQTTEAVGAWNHNSLAAKEMMAKLGYQTSGLPGKGGVLFGILLRHRYEVAMEMLKQELVECESRFGFTTYGNHYYGAPIVMKHFRTLAERGELPLRWAYWVGTNWAATPGQMRDRGDLPFLYRNLGDFRGVGNDYIWNAGVAFEAWETAIIENHII